MPNAKILIFTTASDWPAAARLSAALCEAGFAVIACCPADSFLAATRFIERCVTIEDRIDYAVLVQNLVDLIENQGIDLVVPGDDLAIWLLHRLRRDLVRQHPNAAVTSVLGRSLARLDRQDELELKTRLGETAAVTGLRIPDQIVAPDRAQALDFAGRHGLPIVVKLDRTWGGAGVRVCADAAAIDAALVYAPRALSQLGAPVRRLVQRYIPGQTALVVLAAWQGVVIAGFAALKLHCHPAATGPASVIQRIDHPGLMAAAARLVRYFGLSGFADIEFRLETGTNEPYLLEINPRAQPFCHLGRRFGADLAGALLAAMKGAPLPPPVEITDPRPVALFPNEWCRDPASRYLTEAYHDVPWQDPGLLSRLVAFGEAQLAQRRRPEAISPDPAGAVQPFRPSV